MKTTNENLYSVIFEFKGGTYISQVNAENVDIAFLKWSKELNLDEIDLMGEKTKKELLLKVGENEIEPTIGVKNIWSHGLTLNGHYCYIYFIKTDVMQ